MRTPPNRSAVRVTLDGRAEPARLKPRWFRRSRLPDGSTWLRCGKIPGAYVLSFAGIADFVIGGSGGEIVCGNASAGASLETIRHILIDQVLPLVINLRGREALHATAVATRAGVCAFTGPAGSGKSTLAASFVQSGYPLVCDDCLALSRAAPVMTLPGYPGLRLWDDSIRALGASSRRLHLVAQYTTKSRLQNDAGQADFCATPRRLARIYLLERERSLKVPDAVLIQELDPGDALMGLVKAAYRLDTTDRAMLLRQFQFLSRVAESVPVKRLVIPDEYSALAGVRAAILQDLSKRRAAR